MMMEEDMKPAAAAAAASVGQRHRQEGDLTLAPTASAMSEGADPAAHQHHQSFTPLQSRRLPQPAFAATLCPTMDLIALGLGNVCGTPSAAGADSHHHAMRHHYGEMDAMAMLDAVPIGVSPSVTVHRTISWQKLLTLGAADLTSPPAEEYDDEKVVIAKDDKSSSGAAAASASEAVGRLKDDSMGVDDNDATSTDPADAGAPRGATSLCWSPDGRSFAVGLADGGVLVHDVERSTSTGLGSGAGGGSGGSGGAVHSLTPAPAMVAPSLPKPSPPPDGSSADDTAPVTPAKPTKVTTRSMTASRRLRSGRKGGGRGGGGLPVWKAGSAITGMTWARVGPPHPSWDVTEEEEEVEDAWRYRSNYLDRSSIFLPPCSYSPSVRNDENFPPSHTHYHGTNVAADDEEADEAALDRMACPTYRTPLSVLCVTTCANGSSFYLHGRYRILTVAPPAYAAYNVRGDIVCSADLGTFLVSYTALPPAPAAAATAGRGAIVSSNNMRTVLSLCIVPSIPRYRYELQTISSLYCSIMAHVRAIGKGLSDAASAWSGALRQLDMKFDNLVKLLRDYGAIGLIEVPMDATASTKGNALRLALRQYIVSARSQRTSSSSAALDQFFAAPLMNDQLLQRMIRALESSASSVESIIRKCVLAPSRSLVWDSSELKGLVNAIKCMDGHGVQLMDSISAYGLCCAVESLHLSIETCLKDVVDARFRLRDLLGWIRSTASSVKARGTAPDSALRENARKRRVDDSVVKRVADSFAEDVSPRVVGAEERGRNLTECVLGVPISDYFCAAGDAFESMEDERPPQQRDSLSIKDSLSITANKAVAIFQQPRTALAKSVQRIDIGFSQEGGENVSRVVKRPIAIHKRIGMGSTSDIIIPADDQNKGCFNPELKSATKEHGQASVNQCRHWVFIAKAGESSVDGKTVVQIIALPCAAAGSLSSLYECDENEIRPSFYLESLVILPSGCSVSDIEFYGDDGSSSLNAGVAESVVEGRQGMGLLVERENPPPSAAAGGVNMGGGQVAEELMLFSYDDLHYKYVSVAPGEEKIVIRESSAVNDGSASCCMSLDDEREEVRGWSMKRRVIRVYPKLWSDTRASSGYQASRFALSGSRGVGGVFSEAACSMDLFDLEEDEEEEEDEEGGESFEM